MIAAMSWTSRIIWGAIVLALAFLMLSPLLSRLGLFPFNIAFIGVGIAGLLGVVAAIIALVRMTPVLRDQGKTHLLGAMVLGLLIPFYLFYVFSGARAAAPIHDITTNLDNPPKFETLAPRVYDGPRIFTATQRRALHEVKYRDLTPLEVSASVSDATAAALKAVNAMGLQVAASDISGGHIEATDTTFWFGFKDDVVIRVMPTEDSGAIIDLRSVSRVGIGDVGTNAKRIAKLKAGIAAALE